MKVSKIAHAMALEILDLKAKLETAKDELAAAEGNIRGMLSYIAGDKNAPLCLHLRVEIDRKVVDARKLKKENGELRNQVNLLRGATGKIDRYQNMIQRHEHEMAAVNKKCDRVGRVLRKVRRSRNMWMALAKKGGGM